jgi:wobble nucleotide-excising tRNase
MEKIQSNNQQGPMNPSRSQTEGGRQKTLTVMRRILEHYFKFYGGIKPDDIIEKFDGKEKMICSTLLSWVNDGSHFATDDLYMACDPGQVDRYLNVFQRIFEESDHGGHFRMMMGDDYKSLRIEEPTTHLVV